MRLDPAEQPCESTDSNGLQNYAVVCPMPSMFLHYCVHLLSAGMACYRHYL